MIRTIYGCLINYLFYLRPRKAEQKFGKNIPVLVHSDLKVIDEKGSLLPILF